MNCCVHHSQLIRQSVHICCDSSYTKLAIVWPCLTMFASDVASIIGMRPLLVVLQDIATCVGFNMSKLVAVQSSPRLHRDALFKLQMRSLFAWRATWNHVLSFAIADEMHFIFSCQRPENCSIWKESGIIANYMFPSSIGVTCWRGLSFSWSK